MRTKIIATVGPLTLDYVDEVFSIAHAARFNFSHRNYDFFKKAIKVLRAYDEHLAILADLKGPEIRTQDVVKKEVKKGDVLIIGRDFNVSFENLSDYLSKGDIIKIDDGKVELMVEKTEGSRIYAKSLSDGVIEDNKSVNLPNKDIEMPALTEQDYKDLDFIKKHDFDYIAQSFVKRKEDVVMVKEYLGDYAKNVLIIAKIEHQKAMSNLIDIVKESAGVMVARGDLGVETDIAYLPIYQKRIIDEARKKGKMVIVATHLLRSMVLEPLPSRAEITDIFCSIAHKPDALMLSEETAIGKYPGKAVAYMKHVIEVAEDYYFGKDKGMVALPDMDVYHLIKLISSLEIPRKIKWQCKSVKKKRWGRLMRGIV